MISVRYPVSSREFDSGDLIIRIPISYTGGIYHIDCGNGEWFSLSFNPGTFLARGVVGGSLSQSDVVQYGQKQLNFDEISSVSTRHDIFNSFDMFGNYPELSTGKTENNCHHRSISGMVTLDSNPINAAGGRQTLYPMSLHEMDGKWGWDGEKEHKTTMSGFGLGSAGWYTDYTGKRHAYLEPNTWVEFEHHHYWYRRGSWDPIYTPEKAQELGLIREEVTKVTSSYIQVPGYPLLYFSSIKILPNSRLEYLGTILPPSFGWSKIPSGSTSSTSYSIPNITLLEQSLRDRVPLAFREVESRIKYSDDIWYNLILAGSKEIKRLDMNNIANLLEIPGMIRLFDKLYKKFIDLSSGSKVYKIPGTDKIIKKMSCVYLGIHYGIKLTVMDIAEIIKTFRDNPNLFRQIRRRVVSYSSVSADGTIYNNKSCFRPKAGREITDMRDLTRILGMELSTLNAWDLVPWSFVVDWFIPISDILDSFENIARLESTYDLEYLIHTVSRSEKVNLLDYTFHVKVYDRYVTDNMPQFGFTVGNASGLNNHIIEASALIINSVD